MGRWRWRGLHCDPFLVEVLFFYLFFLRRCQKKCPQHYHSSLGLKLDTELQLLMRTLVTDPDARSMNVLLHW